MRGRAYPAPFLCLVLIDFGQTSVGEYMVRRRKPPNQIGRTFFDNQVKVVVFGRFFTVPTIRFKVICVFPC